MPLSALQEFSAVRVEARHRSVPVANRAEICQNVFSSGSNQFVTYSSAHFMIREATGLRLVYSNRALSGTTDITPADAFTAKASIVVGTDVVPVYFTSSRNVSADGRTVTVAQGEVVISDPVAVSPALFSRFNVRTYFTVDTAGKKVPLLGLVASTTRGEGYAAAADQTDAVSTFSWTSIAAVAGPSAILGTPLDNTKPTVAIVGSSSPWGQGDLADGPTLDLGYLNRALSAAGIGSTRLARPSETLATFLAAPRWRLEALVSQGVTHVIQGHGSNDISLPSTFQVVKDRLIAVWNIYARLGLQIIQPTFTVRPSNSSDSWVTVAGQNVSASDVVRQQINDYIRSKPHSAISHVWDVTALVEDETNSGKWKGSTDGTAAGRWTTDGIHLTPMAHKYVTAWMLDRSGADITRVLDLPSRGVSGLARPSVDRFDVLPTNTL